MPRFVLIGGFLGSGKTTAILRLARQYAAGRRRVGVIANDLGEGLVDTETYRAHGLPVEEMAGVCFACRFDELLGAAGRLQDGHQPDVLLAEPAGSCTDLVSRVIVPLRDMYQDRFNVAPYVALLDPQRAHQALTGRGPGGFSAKVTYLYKMQQNEADVVAINKVDTLNSEQQREVRELVARNFPRAQVMLVSARSGEGFDRLAGLLDGDARAGQHPLGVGDFEAGAFAEGDARLGWLNGSWQLTAEQEFDGDRLLLDLVGALQESLGGAEPAHVKMSLRSGDHVGVANVVSSDRPAELSQSSGARVSEGILTINARVEVDPSVLRERVEFAVGQITAAFRVTACSHSLTVTAPEGTGQVRDANVVAGGER